MSYTSLEQVRNHLPPHSRSIRRLTDQPFVLDGTEYMGFYAGEVEASSVAVKSLRDKTLQRQVVTLSAGATSLLATFVAPGSVVVASDSSLGTIYTENEDYVVDCAAGLLSMKDGGDLQFGQTVTVWFRPYVVYTRGLDYQLRADRGDICRLGGGGIADGESVFLDFTPLDGGIEESLLTAAVREANGMVERTIDQDRQFGADPALVSAATYQALEIACRGAAARALMIGQGQDRVAACWMKLADQYGALAKRLLDGFRPPCLPPASPSRT